MTSLRQPRAAGPVSRPHTIVEQKVAGQHTVMEQEGAEHIIVEQEGVSTTSLTGGAQHTMVDWMWVSTLC